MYLIALCLHLICAIGFVGYVFFDVCVYALAYKKEDKHKCDAVKKAYTLYGARIFGIIFMLLILSGIWLLSFYDLKSIFNLSSYFNIFFWIKIFLIILMFLLTFYAIFFIRVLKKADPFKGKSHLLALLLSFLIIICAKMMQYFT